ncbi:queuosine salvage protein [Maniola jurtina]|uniref:queuosine salvage protein n=1 Tax=Maniola jurtina TaxID=191418 RepID=UPI001E689B26|nr:queuosine salvage protein [Maniola jurtina]
MVRNGVLPPAQSGEFISERSRHVKIHSEGIEKLCDEILSSLKDNKLQIPETNTDSIHPNKDHPHAVDWVFVTDALNFCFWSRNKDEQWTVDGHTGYFALEASLHRALKEGYDITNPEYYSKITQEDLKHIFRGDTDAEIPLFDQRIAVLHEVGTILIEKYNKTFETCVKEANKSAVKLLNIVVENFPCFCDEALYEGCKVSLHKRAQILVADLWNFHDGNGWGEFHDIDKLTMFADYRVPQVLVYFGAMSYSDELMDKLRNDILLPSGSLEEVEIRGCSIHTIELLKQKLIDRITTDKLNVEVPNSSLLDYYLWCYRRKHATEMEKIPYHKTLGIYY